MIWERKDGLDPPVLGALTYQAVLLSALGGPLRVLLVDETSS